MRGSKQGRLRKSIKITLNLLLGPVLFGWLAWALWQRLSTMPDLPRHAGELASGFRGRGLLQLLPILALVAVNWGAEALKWRWLLRHVCPISFGRACRSVLAGVALSVATPNRIGEYGARILYIPEGHRLQAVSLSMMGGLVQLLVTLTAGMAAFLLPGSRLGEALTEAGLTEGLRTLVTLSTAAFIILCVLLILRIEGVLRLVSHWRLARRVTVHLTALPLAGRRQWVAVCGLSALRYAVFIVQYLLMLQAMQVEVGWADGARAVAIFFFLMSVLPSIALLELGMRWQYSLLVFGAFSSDILGICAASTGIWLVNLALPALAGTLLMLGIRLHRERVARPPES